MIDFATFGGYEFPEDYWQQITRFQWEVARKVQNHCCRPNAQMEVALDTHNQYYRTLDDMIYTPGFLQTQYGMMRFKELFDKYVYLSMKILNKLS